MIKYRITCPDCSASVYAIYPEAILWERCPACLRHTWDTCDIQMADAIPGHAENAKHAGAGSYSPNGPLN